MATPAFEQAIAQLLEFATASAGGGFEGGAHRTAIMCAEAVWWRCHRQLVADALVARGVEVRHISTDRAAPPHELTDFARVNDGKVSYPGLVR